MKRTFFALLAFLMSMAVLADNVSDNRIKNPILPGFNPDPSICAVGSDYYLVTSSFVFVPGLPVYHSRDLVNWELISHGIDRQNIDKFHFENLNDNDGIWAPTIRYHDGLFYIVCTMHRSGGNCKWYSPLGRETFLVRVEQQDDQLIFAPGVGYVETEIERPNLPWCPFP